MSVVVDGLRKRYGTADVLDDVSFEVRPGETVALLGPNGAGKTTTVEILEGFRRRSGGTVRVLGADPQDADEQWRARVGVVLQSWRDHGKWRVRELLAQQAAYYDEPWELGDLLAVTGLTAQAGQKIQTLSGGQRRRLDVAIGLVGRPDLLFLDEPTTGFDPIARRELHDLIEGLAITILLTTHDLDEASRLARRILVLDHGRVIGDGTTAELAARLGSPGEVRWAIDGDRFARATDEPGRLVHDLWQQHGEALRDLEVRRPSLEDTYLALVRTAEGVRR